MEVKGETVGMLSRVLIRILPKVFSKDIMPNTEDVDINYSI